EFQPAIRMARNIAKAAIRRPRGFDLFHDLGTVLESPRVIFDVGANIGQSAKRYLKEFPQAEVYSFEPVAATYGPLTADIASNRFKPAKLAFGSEPSAARMDTTTGSSDMFQISETGNEAIEVSTLDLFWQDERPIDFLKIDTEGHDLEALKGADKLLRDKRI